MNHGAADKTSGKQDQRSVGVNGQSLREFLELLALSVFPAYTDGHLHQYALAAALGARVKVSTRDLSHTTSLENNYTRRTKIVESIAAAVMQNGYLAS